MAHHHTDLPHQPADSRRRLLAADPFPPLSPPTLDGPVGSSADFDVAASWSGEDLRRDLAGLEAEPGASDGAALSASHGRPAVDPFAPAPYAGPEPLAGASLPRHYAAPGARNGAANGYAASGDLERLRAENEEMHKLIEEMKQLFEQASAQEEENTRELTQQRERTSGLELQVLEKDEQVQLLTLQIQELEQHIQEAQAAPPSEDELSKMADELEKERCKLTQDRREVDQERQQLREDEESLMKQMREMEVQMAKERADMARQRTELQRLHGEIRHDLDQLNRGDGALKDRMAQFHRRHQEVFNRPVHAAPSAPAPAPEADVLPPAKANGESGIIRRLFGRK